MKFGNRITLFVFLNFFFKFLFLRRDITSTPLINLEKLNRVLKLEDNETTYKWK